MVSTSFKFMKQVEMYPSALCYCKKYPRQSTFRGKAYLGLVLEGSIHDYSLGTAGKQHVRTDGKLFSSPWGSKARKRQELRSPYLLNGIPLMTRILPTGLHVLRVPPPSDVVTGWGPSL